MATKTVITSPDLPKPVAPYSQGILAKDFIFISGQVGIDPTSGKLVPGGVEAETRQALTNMVRILEAAGSSLAHVVKTTVFLADITTFSVFNTIYGEYFSSEPPARSAFQVAALPIGAAVEIEAIALRK